MSSQENKLLSRRSQRQGCVLSQEPPCAPPLVVCCLSCLDLMSCTVPLPTRHPGAYGKIISQGRRLGKKLGGCPHIHHACQWPGFPRARVKSQLHFCPPSLTGPETSSHPPQPTPGPQRRLHTDYCMKRGSEGKCQPWE